MPSDRPLSLGYVGCGFLAQSAHIPNFASLNDCRLIALAELRPRLAERVASRHRIPTVYRTHLELAEDPRVEAVGVSGPFDVQGDIAADLLRAGKHVFVEKPLALSVEQAERILAAERQGGARLMVGYMKRYDPGNRFAREKIDEWQQSGAMGDLLYARVHTFCGDWRNGHDVTSTITTDEPADPNAYKSFTNLPRWLPSGWASHYVWFLQLHTHSVNLLRYLLGAGDDVRVRAVDLDADGFTGVVVLDLAGVRATIESGELDHDGWDEHTQIYFKQGWIRLVPRPVFVPGPSSVEIYEGIARDGCAYPVVGPSDAWPYRQEAAAFVRCVRTGERFGSSGEDTLTDVRVFEEIFRRLVARGSAAAPASA
jgi:predicted dehydrogenase